MNLTARQRFPYRRRPLAAALGLALPLGFATLGLAENAETASPERATPQQTQSETPKTPTESDALRERQQELDAIRAEQKKAEELEARLKAEIAAIGDDRRKLNEQLVQTATRVQSMEGQIAGAETRAKQLDQREAAIRSSLDERRAVIVEILAALQRIGRRPPPAIVVRPEDALESVRSAMMLGAVLPEMRGQAQTLVDDLTELARLRKEIVAERDQLARGVAQLAEERQRMTLLVDERQKKQSETEQSLEAERQRAVRLGRQVDNLQELIAKLEQNLETALRASRAAAAAAKAAEDGKAADGRPSLAALNDPGRLGPAIAFASAKGMLRLPVSGVRLRDFGSPDKFGGVERGLSMATRAGAQVTTPCDGWVVYAGPFRSYGQLLILNAGGGYHVLIAGMERISVDLGQFVLTGEPIAVMGGGSPVAAITGSGSNQPVLYVEFRKDGAPVDPSPWWATSEVEKVRG